MPSTKTIYASLLTSNLNEVAQYYPDTTIGDETGNLNFGNLDPSKYAARVTKVVHFPILSSEVENYTHDPRRPQSDGQVGEFIEKPFVFSHDELGQPTLNVGQLKSYCAALGLAKVFSSGYFIIEIEMVPFETKTLTFGNLELVLVNEMIARFDNANIKTYVNKLLAGLSWETKQVVVVGNVNDVQSFSTEAQKINLDTRGGKPDYSAITISVTDSQEIRFSNTKYQSYNENYEAIKDNRGYLANILLNFADNAEPRGGYNTILFSNTHPHNDGNTLIHELSHSLAPFFNQFGVDNIAPFLNRNNGHWPSKESRDSIKAIYKNWRNFGDGEMQAFDAAHPRPNLKISSNLHACPLIYLGDNDSLLPMLSSTILSYNDSHVVEIGTVHAAMTLAGAETTINTYFATHGQVFKHEAFISLVDDYAIPSGHEDGALPDDADVFVTFNRERFAENFGKVQDTMSWFLKTQILWGGIEDDNHTVSDSYTSSTRIADRVKIESTFFNSLITYDGFTRTQQQEYKIQYADKPTRVDFFKRAKTYTDAKNASGAPAKGTAHSHVHNEVLNRMGFEVLEDVIEVINGEPRRNHTGVAKYDYIISKARGNTEEELATNYSEDPNVTDDEAARITSLWGGEKFAKKLCVKNAQGEEESKYVYVIFRDAVDLEAAHALQSVTITDDKNKNITIV